MLDQVDNAETVTVQHGFDSTAGVDDTAYRHLEAQTDVFMLNVTLEQVDYLLIEREKVKAGTAAAGRQRPRSGGTTRHLVRSSTCPARCWVGAQNGRTSATWPRPWRHGRRRTPD